MNTSPVNTNSLVSSASMDKASKQVGSDLSNTDFRDIMGNLTEKRSTLQEQIKNTASAKSLEKDSKSKEAINNVKDSDSNQANIKDKSDDQVKSVTKENTEQEDYSKEDELEKVSKRIKSTLLDVLNVSEEDLEAAMQVLGLNYLDCLDKNNLSQLLAKMNGSNDISMLLTDGALYQKFNDALMLLDGVKDTIMADLGISEEDLDTLLTQFKEMNVLKAGVPSSKNDVMQNTTQETTLGATMVSDATEPKEDATKQEKTDINVANTLSTETTKVKVTSTQAQNSSSEQQTNEQESNVNKLMSSADTEDKTDTDYQKFIPRQEIQKDFSQNVDNTIGVNEKTTVDAESLMKQIQSQIKLTTSLDTTKMQFQLNPEHLGKLTIQLASKEGVITAQITAQNIAVKEVLESQIIQLRENMNNQGLKVEAVEVTVESHEFERNLEQGNHNSNQEQEEQQQKNARRQFNYNDLESLEDMTDEEALIAEMMIGNGNSINYTA